MAIANEQKAQIVADANRDRSLIEEQAAHTAMVNSIVGDLLAMEGVAA